VAAEGDDEEAMARLTTEKTALEAGSEGNGAMVLNLSHRVLSDVSGSLPITTPASRGVMLGSVAHGVSVVREQVSCLSRFKNLERLDLGYNCLVTLEVTV
jgi:hypothetical protein